MQLKKIKNRFKPYFKPLIKIRENITNKHKVLKFKKQKWEKFINYFKKKTKFYRRYKLKDQNLFIISKFPIRRLSYKRRYKNSLMSTKKLTFFYGGISNKVVKKTNKRTKLNQNNYTFLRELEQRIDTVLFRSKLCTSIRNARQLISHEKVFVNKKIVKESSYSLKLGDFISIEKTAYQIIENNLVNNFMNSNIWPLPPKYLTINYKTMEIIVGQLENTNQNTFLNFTLNLEKIRQNSQNLQ